MSRRRNSEQGAPDDYEFPLRADAKALSHAPLFFTPIAVNVNGERRSGLMPTHLNNKWDSCNSYFIDKAEWDQISERVNNWFEDPECASYIEDEELAKMLELYTEDTVSEVLSTIMMPDHDPGFVYLISSDVGYYKIGKSRNLKDRMKQFAVKLPFAIQEEHVIASTHHTWAENTLHKKYRECRLKGEWFQLTPEQVDEIKSIKRLDKPRK